MGTRHTFDNCARITIIQTSCGYSSAVERQLPKLDVRGSSPLTRSWISDLTGCENLSGLFLPLPCRTWNSAGGIGAGETTSCKISAPASPHLSSAATREQESHCSRVAVYSHDSVRQSLLINRFNTPSPITASSSTANPIPIVSLIRLFIE